MKKPCLDCGTLSNNTRCEQCRLTRQRAWERMRPRRHRPHYDGDYRKRAAEVRATATICWLCGKGPLPGDPWTADHVVAGDPQSPLAAAHRSCNSRRGSRPPLPYRPA